MIKFKAIREARALREARLDPVDYTVGSEKGPKGGFRALITHSQKGHVMYSGGKMFKSAKDAEGHAQAYLDGYAASGDRGASRSADVYATKNKSKLMKEDAQLDEAFQRIPGNMINGELPRAAKDLESVIKGLKAGNDFDEKAFNKVLAALNNIKKSAKSFKSADDVTTPYQYRADPRYKK